MARDYCPFAMVAGIERFDATGGASKARTPEMNAQRLCKDAKPTKHTQTLALRKVMHEAIRIIRIELFLKSQC